MGISIPQKDDEKIIFNFYNYSRFKVSINSIGFYIIKEKPIMLFLGNIFGDKYYNIVIRRLNIGPFVSLDNSVLPLNVEAKSSSIYSVEQIRFIGIINTANEFDLERYHVLFCTQDSLGNRHYLYKSF